jgi:hypothetical protein
VYVEIVLCIKMPNLRFVEGKHSNFHENFERHICNRGLIDKCHRFGHLQWAQVFQRKANQQANMSRCCKRILDTQVILTGFLEKDGNSSHSKACKDVNFKKELDVHKLLVKVHDAEKTHNPASIYQHGVNE